MKAIYVYYRSCIEFEKDVDDLHEMIENNLEITYNTFIKYVPFKELFKMFPQYLLRGGLHIKDDYAVSFHRSKIKNVKCYYVRHSMIEYIWIQHYTLQKRGRYYIL